MKDLELFRWVLKQSHVFSKERDRRQFDLNREKPIHAKSGRETGQEPARLEESREGIRLRRSGGDSL